MRCFFRFNYLSSISVTYHIPGIFILDPSAVALWSISALWPEFAIGNLLLAHRMLLLRWTQRICGSKATQGTISATLPSGGGTYYLVFNNGFSIFAKKTVQAAVTLHYIP
jgi:hypothetical protein